jgi:hypothetical protein
MLSAWSAPPAVTVKAAAAEQQNQHNDDQQQIHSILQKSKSMEPLLAGGFG